MNRLLAALFLIAALPACCQQLFNISNGDSQCSITKVGGAQIKFSYQCSNPRGSMSGSYTANANNTALDFLRWDFGSLPAAALGNPMISCGVAINGTTNPISAGSYGTIAPSSIAANCTPSAKQVSANASWP